MYFQRAALKKKKTGSIVVVQSLSHVRLFATPWSVACQDLWHFPGKNTGVDLPNPGTEPAFPELVGSFFTTESQGKQDILEYWVFSKLPNFIVVKQTFYW